MNRRTFLVSSFMFGLLLAVGVKAKHVPEPARITGPVWVRVSTDESRNAYSLDGKTWVKGFPPNGTPVTCFQNPYGGALYQDNPRHMPTWHNGMICFEGIDSKGFDRATAPDLGLKIAGDIG